VAGLVAGAGLAYWLGSTREPPERVAQQEIYVLDDDNRLILHPVRIAFRQNGLALVREGLSGGERVVIDDLVPATAGMAIAPRAAPDVEEWLASAAGGA
jgi:hypothetical protein